MHPSAALAFVVVENGVGRIDDEVSLAAQLEAVVDVVEGDGEVLVEAADGVEDVRPRHHARRRDGGAVPHAATEPEVVARVDVSGYPARADHDALVLRMTVRVHKARAHSADSRPLTMLDHRLNPFA